MDDSSLVKNPLGLHFENISCSKFSLLKLVFVIHWKRLVFTKTNKCVITSSWVFFELVPERKARRESLTNSSIKDQSRAMLGLDNNSKIVNQPGCLCNGVITILIAWIPKMVTRMKSPHDVLRFNQKSFRARVGSKPLTRKIDSLALTKRQSSCDRTHALNAHRVSNGILRLNKSLTLGQL